MYVNITNEMYKHLRRFFFFILSIYYFKPNDAHVKAYSGILAPHTLHIFVVLVLSAALTFICILLLHAHSSIQTQIGHPENLLIAISVLH